MKPTITHAQEVVLAYLSAHAPLGEVFYVDVSVAAKDLGYGCVRPVYSHVKKLRELGAITSLRRAQQVGRTGFVAHMREEDCNVISPTVRVKRSKPVIIKAPKPQPAPIIKKRPLIAYVGKEKHAWA